MKLKEVRIVVMVVVVVVLLYEVRDDMLLWHYNKIGSLIMGI